jgi:small GTP-binding protein
MMKRNSDDLMKLKVCLVGDAAVGKTSLIRKFVYDEYSDEYITTIGTKITKREMVVPNPDGDGNIAIDMAIWDIMGQHGFRALLQEAYFFGVDGIIAVCDLTRPRTLEGVKDWLGRTFEIAGDVPIITVGNKNDLGDEKTVSEEDLERVAEQYHAEYSLSSAKTGENVERIFDGLVNEILRRIMEKRYSEDVSATAQDVAEKQAS